MPDSLPAKKKKVGEKAANGCESPANETPRRDKRLKLHVNLKR